MNMRLVLPKSIASKPMQTICKRLLIHSEITTKIESEHLETFIEM